jgi:hypothetical protein
MKFKPTIPDEFAKKKVSGKKIPQKPPSPKNMREGSPQRKRHSQGRKKKKPVE